MVTPLSSSASMRLGFSAVSLSSTGSSFGALMVLTGSARTGAVQWLHSHWIDASGRFVSTTTRSAWLI